MVLPPKNSSGAGFGFENDVVSLHAAWMLAASFVNPYALGAIIELRVQVHADGWGFDDLLVTFEGGERLQASIKSNVQVNGAGPSDAWLKAAWRQVLGAPGSPFVPERDFIGLLTAPQSVQVSDDLHTLIGLARHQDPADLARRVEGDRMVSEARRTLFRGFDCPADVAAERPDAELSPGLLLARLQALEFDFERHPSRDHASAIEVLASLGVEDPQGLWDDLRQLVQQARHNAGTLERDALRAKLEVPEPPPARRGHWLPRQQRALDRLSTTGDLTAVDSGSMLIDALGSAKEASRTALDSADLDLTFQSATQDGFDVWTINDASRPRHVAVWILASGAAPWQVHALLPSGGTVLSPQPAACERWTWSGPDDLQPAVDHAFNWAVRVLSAEPRLA